MTKELRIKITAFFCACVVSTFAFLSPLISLKATATPVSWGDVGQDIADTAQQYSKAISSLVGGDVGGALGHVIGYDANLVKTLADGVLAISPVDDIWYWLVGGNLWVHDKDGEREVTAPEDVYVRTSDLRDCYSFLSSSHCFNTNSFVSLKHGAVDDWYLPLIKTGQNRETYILPFYFDGTQLYYYSTEYFFYNVITTGSCQNEIGTTSTGGYSVNYKYSNVVSGSTLLSPTVFDNARSLTSYGYIEGCSLYLYFNSVLPDQYVYTKGSDNSWYLNYNSPWVSSSPLGFVGIYTSSSGDFSTVTTSTLSAVSSTPIDYGYFLSNSPILYISNPYQQQQDIITNISNNTVLQITNDTGDVNNYNIVNKNGDTYTVNYYITNIYGHTEDAPDTGTEDSGGGSGGGSSIGGDGDTTISNTTSNNFFLNLGIEIQNTFNLLFIPKENYFSDMTTNFQDKLSSKLPVFADMGELLSSLFVEIKDDNLVYASDVNLLDEDCGQSFIIYPNWQVDFDFFGERYQLTILDFSMYVDVLGPVRLFVMVFIYIVYFVNLFRYLPTLIANVADMAGTITTKVNTSSGGEKK